MVYCTLQKSISKNCFAVCCYRNITIRKRRLKNEAWVTVCRPVVVSAAHLLNLACQVCVQAATVHLCVERSRFVRKRQKRKE